MPMPSTLPMAARVARGLRRARRGFTLVELMVVVAVAAVILALAAPSFSEYIVTQRLRSIHAQLSTDMAFARSEAISQRRFVGVHFRFTPGPSGASCYTIFSRDNPRLNTRQCNCFEPIPANRCPNADTRELRTVLIPNSTKVFVRVPTGQHAILNFEPDSGGYVPGQDASSPADLLANGFKVTTDTLDSRALRISVIGTGRIQQCTPSGSVLGGETCP
jgi:type IV fimbrial biogenesis protein FimT